MDLLVKTIGEHKVTLLQGEHVKNGQKKNHTAIPILLKDTQMMDLKAVIAATQVITKKVHGVIQQILGKDGNPVSLLNVRVKLRKTSKTNKFFDQEWILDSGCCLLKS